MSNINNKEIAKLRNHFDMNQAREEGLLPLNDKIRRLVLESGLSLSKIERLSGIGRVNLHNIIRGETKNISLKNAFLLADFFDIDVNDFREERLK